MDSPNRGRVGGTGGGEGRTSDDMRLLGRTVFLRVLDRLQAEQEVRHCINQHGLAEMDLKRPRIISSSVSRVLARVGRLVVIGGLVKG